MVTTSEEEILPATLTPSESVLNDSQTQPNVYAIWGRLISCRAFLKSIDLMNISFTLGRSDECDVIMLEEKVTRKCLLTISKKHFEISKSLDSPAVYITDLSKNGTYINREKIGRNKRYVLKDNDVISIGVSNFEVYVFKNMGSHSDDFLPRELNEKYEALKMLGKGACGEVKLCIERFTCNKYAIKKIVKGTAAISQVHKINHPSKIESEISILKSLSHPCIIGMREIIETHSEVFIVLEYMRGGELSRRILSMERMSEVNTKFLFYQMILAVQYLHSKGIAHRDLKPENILLYSEDPETLIKVSDFGLSKVTEGQDNMQTICGTLNYAAPEVLHTKFREYGEYGKQVDIWSLGVILYYMLTKELPFFSGDKAILVKQIVTGSYTVEGSAWKGISPLAKDLVKKMLTVHPQYRISINEIIWHPWISKDIVLQTKVHAMLTIHGDQIFNISEPPRKRCRYDFDTSLGVDTSDSILDANL